MISSLNMAEVEKHVQARKQTQPLTGEGRKLAFVTVAYSCFIILAHRIYYYEIPLVGIYDAYTGHCVSSIAVQ